MDIPEEIEFNGIKYKRMGGDRNYYLSQSNTNSGRVGAKGLHVAIWEFFSGKKVPLGHLVHHKDHNPLNNDYDNLECISFGDHSRLHGKGASSERMAELRVLATEWHRSDEGREWHREHYSSSLGKVGPKKKECLNCGDEFYSKKHNAKYCSTKCRQRHYFAIGRTSKISVCERCSREFRTGNRSSGRFCRNKCKPQNNPS